MRKKILKPLVIILAMALTLGGCSGSSSESDKSSSAPYSAYTDETDTGTEKNTESSGTPDESSKEESSEGGSYFETQKDISVTLTTDKTEYQNGETVNFKLVIKNDREGCNITQTFIDYVCTGGLSAAAGADLPSKLKLIKEGEESIVEGAFEYSGRTDSKSNAASTAAGVENVTVRPYVKITYGGEEAMVRMVVSMNMVQKTEEIPADKKLNYSTVSCHDPSIFKDTDGTYYVFGTHMGLASSTDLANWKDMTASFRASFTEETKEKIRQWNKDDNSGSWYGYLWAPDVIYNPVMGKYCMYLSANGDDWVSDIVLLTADSATGPYSYVGSVVYGGFTEENWEKTDVKTVLNEESLPKRYITNGVKNRKWGDEYPNCIDPCVFYDDDGKLWMSYGSWSGGIFMLELDEETGLRDYSVTYETNAHSDAYFGTKIAGGKYVSGEGSYIQKIGDYYYLFISYGNLEAKGGYNIRVFRSKRPDGDYVDALGNDAFYDKYVFNYNLSKGVRLFGGYKWIYQGIGQVAQGHNSAFVDDDGNAYIVFHTRTTNGSEGHYVKVHKLFVNEDGWLCAAPYQTNNDGSAGVKVGEIAGDYYFLKHDLDIDFKNLGVNTCDKIRLLPDGSIEGAVAGNWKVDDEGKNIELTIDGNIYNGVVFKQYIEGSTLETVVFTALGKEDQLTVWGSKKV